MHSTLPRNFLSPSFILSFFFSPFLAPTVIAIITTLTEPQATRLIEVKMFPRDGPYSAHSTGSTIPSFKVCSRTFFLASLLGFQRAIQSWACSIPSFFLLSYIQFISTILHTLTPPQSHFLLLYASIHQSPFPPSPHSPVLNDLDFQYRVIRSTEPPPPLPLPTKPLPRSFLLNNLFFLFFYTLFFIL
ncbi:hypothetical protein K435DRAFT_150438 [Dendrothele bispora CBS 962.96]|uniref:Uncharacterized protein n=1 Tax=Dendrothele bispora (strain CBS 962.96) TaxID=1314807 RepID=A0A4S8LZ70_DENBC|nr:hypothetical protein K435DRAFT_150438 [Dendrothele bispora CBS 962.96]